MIDVVTHNGAGFSSVFKSDTWQIATVTYAPQYSKEGFTHMKKHLTTDEVFVLVKGNAVIHTYEDGSIKTITLEKEKIYCIEKNTWHYLEISNDAFLIAVENAEVLPEHTERMEIK